MNYTVEQKEQIRSNLEKIVGYIDKSILPHITYDYTTGNFGPMETWGVFDENNGRRYTIELNGPYHDKIRFCYADISYEIWDLVDNFTDLAVNFLTYWQDAKSYMNTEIRNNADKIKTIESFEV